MEVRKEFIFIFPSGNDPTLTANNVLYSLFLFVHLQQFSVRSFISLQSVYCFL